MCFRIRSALITITAGMSLGSGPALAFLLIVVLHPAAASSATITLGTFQERHWVYRNGVVVVSDDSGTLSVPGDLGIDYSNSDGAQIVGRALTSATPAADVQIEVNYPGGTSSISPYYEVEAQSLVNYYYRIDYVGTGTAPVSSIPLAISYALASSYTIDIGDFQHITLNAYFQGPGRSDSAVISFSAGTAGAPRSDRVERNLTYTYDLVSNNWGRDLLFKVNSSIDVVGIFTGRRPAASGQFQTVADPQVTFAPGFAHADLFMIQVSPNITLVPEPGTGLLVLAGLLGLAARRRWRVAS
jgi:hypothetical protein